MDNAGFVKSGQGVGDFDAVAEGLTERDLPLREARRKRLSFQVLHDQEVDAILVANIKQRTNVRV
jgi:hypothetical protein